jgi:hypothetical protein
MALEPHRFKRVVLGLQQSAPDRAMRCAVDLADLLHLELLGLFLDDTSLRDLASMPFAREFRPLGGGWHPIDVDRLSHDLEIAARNTERMFAEAVKRLPTKCQFEVIRGSTAESITSISRTGDIVMVVEPPSPAERITQQFLWLIEAAFRSAGAVMLVPTRIARTTGPVVAIAAAPADPSIRAAAAIAMAAKEGVVVVEAYEGAADDSHIRKLAADTGLTIKHVVAGRSPLSDAAGFAPAFRQIQERLVVMTRGVLDDQVASMIASARRVPVLVIEVPETMNSDAAQQPQTAP